MIFLSYRHEDEPFAVALLYAILTADKHLPDVYLDSLRNRRARLVGRRLSAAIAQSSVVVCLMGPRWDRSSNLHRLGEEGDWVRQEILQAREHKIPMIPVFTNRNTPLALEVPDILRSPRTTMPSVLRRASFMSDAATLAARITEVLRGQQQRPPAPPQPASINGRPEVLSRELLARAVDAMQRHVLPLPQHAMKNLENLNAAVSSPLLLPDGEWLEHVAIGHLPQRPSGSTLVTLTDQTLRVAQLDESIVPTLYHNVPLRQVRSVRHRDWSRLGVRSMADLLIATDKLGDVDIRAIFADPARRLRELLQEQNTHDR